MLSEHPLCGVLLRDGRLHHGRGGEGLLGLLRGGGGVLARGRGLLHGGHQPHARDLCLVISSPQI